MSHHFRYRGLLPTCPLHWSQQLEHCGFCSTDRAKELEHILVTPPRHSMPYHLPPRRASVSDGRFASPAPSGLLARGALRSDTSGLLSTHLLSWPPQPGHCRPCSPSSCHITSGIAGFAHPPSLLVSTARPLRVSPACPRCVTSLQVSWAYTHPSSLLVSTTGALQALSSGSGTKARACLGDPCTPLHVLSPAIV